VRAAAALLALMATSAVARAAPDTTDVRDLLASKERVSAVAAVDLLGADDLEVFRPSTARDLAASLRTVYVDGAIVPEYALEVSPWHLWVGPRVSYRDYLASAAHPILQRTSLSLATTSRTVGGVDVTFGAVGARVKLVDRTDWRLDRARVDCVLTAAALPPPPAVPGAEVVEDGDEPTDADIERAFAACERTGRWNAAQWSIDAAVSSAFPGGDPRRDIHDAAVSTVFAVGVGDWLRVGGGARYGFADTRRDDDGRRPARHVVGAGATLEARQARWGLLLDAGAGYRFVDERPDAPGADAGLLLASAELQLGLTGDTWLSLRVAADVVLDGEDGARSLASLHWNLETLPARKE
jgi:hypothetical protein